MNAVEVSGLKKAYCSGPRGTAVLLHADRAALYLTAVVAALVALLRRDVDEGGR